MSDIDPTLQILIEIREELAGLTRTRKGIKETKKEASELGMLLRQGLGIGTGMEVARRSIDLLRNSLRQSVGEAFRHADITRSQARAANVTAEAYQVLSRELLDNNVGAERLNDAFQSQVDRLTEARNGAESAVRVYRDLGLEIADMERLSPDQQMIRTAEAVLNAEDRTRAFYAAGQILGTGGVQPLINALRRLATEGYDKVAESAIAANQVMSEDTLERLASARKEIENFQRAATIVTGESIGSGARALESLRNAPGDTLLALLAAGTTGVYGANALVSTVARNSRPRSLPSEAPTTVPPAELERQLLERLKQAESEYAALVGDNTRTEIAKRADIVDALEKQFSILSELSDLKFPGSDELERLAQSLSDGTITEGEILRLREYLNIQERLASLPNVINDARGRAPSALDRLRDAAGGMNDPTINPGAMTAGEGVEAGALQWMLSLGSTGEQVAAVMQGSLGMTLDSIAGRLAGNDVREWGDVWRSVLANVLQQLIVLQLQLWAIRALGFFGIGGAAPTGQTGAGTPMIAAAGGGTFMTRGPTQLTVGDNPGGVELVSVLPLSGVGQTRLTGGSLAMAGGGVALAAGAGALGLRRPVHVHQTIHVSTGVQETVRAELFGMMPMLRASTTDGVMDAMARNEINP